MASQTPDRFDRIPADLERVGAHRSAAKRGRGWAGFAWAVLATGVLVLGGLFGLSLLGTVDLGLPNFSGGGNVTPTPTPTPTPTAEPLTDPATIGPERGIQITVLNGAPTNNLDDTVGAGLAAAGWPIGAMTQASVRTIEDTTIYYADPLNEDIARGIAITLGTGQIRLVPLESMPSSAPIAIVLGADFPVPAG
jgi:hypothetical protein